MDKRNCTNVHHLYDMVKTLIIKFRSRYPEFSEHTIKVFTESNSSFAGDNIHLTIGPTGFYGSKDITTALYGKLEFYSENKKRYGMFKDKYKSRDYVDLTRGALFDNSLVFHKKLCTGNPKVKDIMTLVNAYSKEMKGFKCPDEDSDNPRYNKRMKLKIGGKNGGRTNDDLAITVLMAVYYWFKFSTDYREMKEFTDSYMKMKQSVYETFENKT